MSGAKPSSSVAMGCLVWAWSNGASSLELVAILQWLACSKSKQRYGEIPDSPYPDKIVLLPFLASMLQTTLNYCTIQNIRLNSGSNLVTQTAHVLQFIFSVHYIFKKEEGESYASPKFKQDSVACLSIKKESTLHALRAIPKQDVPGVFCFNDQLRRGKTKEAYQLSMKMVDPDHIRDVVTISILVTQVAKHGKTTLLMVGKHTDDSGYFNASRKLLEFIAKVMVKYWTESGSQHQIHGLGRRTATCL
ncbi:hypothetical protein QYE76_011334 [Lolium multiflorum]|uniref:Uncharacterized protein n=1 Tax=Lolium multiflorum TaxID=4521 RepID=A0AAD8X566_LOLMU|nr:hypothetical protein QYE76_011334 [Lolium multiflorum]